MYNSLLKHEWLRAKRSASYEREAATKFLIGFLIVMFGGYLLAFAFFLDNLLKQFSSDPHKLLSEILIYYFFTELMFRYFLQSVPVLNIQPYLHLPVGKKKIVHFLLGKSVFTLLNVLTPVLFAPYAFLELAPEIGTSQALLWWVNLWLISLGLHYFIIIFKKELDDHPLGLAMFLALVFLFGGSQYYGWFSLGEITAPFFEAASSSVLVSLVLIAGLFALYSLNFRFLIGHTYLEDWSKKESTDFYKDSFTFLQSFGSTGDLIQQELKLITRHKRPRTIIFMCVLFLLYGLIFYTNPMYMNEMPGFLLFVGIFVTGIFMINYGQFLFSWNSGSFDFYLTKPVSMQQYIKAKFILMNSITLICMVLTIPYLYFGWKVLLINVCMAFFNMGINVFIIMNLAMWGPKKIDLQKGGMLNYEGIGAAQWVMGLPVLLAPYVVYVPLSLSGYPIAGILSLGFIGIIGIIFHDQLIKLTVNRLIGKKYQIAKSFRND